MRTVGIGHLLFAVGFVVVGAIGLVAHDFVLSQQPVPDGLPSRELLACISGAVLLLAGVGLLIVRTARLAALVLAGFMVLWVLALHLPRVVSQPGVEAYWLGAGEVTTLAMGGWLIYCAVTPETDGTLRIARTVFGLALIPIGISHFVYLKLAADFIPTWFPFHVPLTEISGAGHIAAGLAIVFGIVPRLAATLEAVMESLFTLIVWVSAVIATPTNRQDWVNLFISTALTGASWALAESYCGMPAAARDPTPGRSPAASSR
jgi:uncharacterized membrane protein YphA (DoxX/SURF4 family)